MPASWYYAVPVLTTTTPSGLVLASAYLSTAPPVDYSFALDKPLHTLAILLLLAGLALVAADAWSSRRPHHQHHHHYVAFALNNVHTRHPGEEIWTEAGHHAPRRPWSLRAVGALLALLLFAMCGRIAIFYRVTRNIECTGPPALVRPIPRPCPPQSNHPPLLTRPGLPPPRCRSLPQHPPSQPAPVPRLER